MYTALQDVQITSGKHNVIKVKDNVTTLKCSFSIPMSELFAILERLFLEIINEPKQD